jgi:hypothetical protein
MKKVNKLFCLLSICIFSTQLEAQIINAENSKKNLNSQFQEGAASYSENKKQGFVNQTGDLICIASYDRVRPYVNGYAPVFKSQKWSFINKQGQLIAELRYDWVGNFNEGYAPVNLNEKWGFINEQGIEIVPAIYEMVKIENQKFFVKKNNEWQIVEIVNPNGI